jgi:hypothetical protein
MTASALTNFPAGFDYRLATNEEKDHFHAVIGELLATEHMGGLEATHELDELLQAARAQLCKAWIEDAREQLKQLIQAKHFVAMTLESDVTRQLEQATRAAEKAAARLADAKQANDRAAADKKAAEEQVKKLEYARTVAATGDVTLVSAMKRIEAFAAAQ